MADDRYDMIVWRGIPLDRWTAQAAERALNRLPAALRARIRFSQGSPSGAAASAGTHAGRAALDLIIIGGTVAEYRRVERAFRDEMFAFWFRPYLRGVWPSHGHGILIGHPKAHPAAKAQVSSYKRGRNGLKGDGRDANAYRPAKIRTATYAKPTKLRIVQYNLPAGDKIGNAAARIKAAVKLARKPNPHIIGWNELEPIRSRGKSSTFAHAVDAALGKKWRLVRPTRAFNENYISYRGDVLTVVHQYEDSILESGTGGRHITRVVFRYKNGFTFAFGQLHLVNDGGNQGERDRQSQGGDAHTSMLAVTAKHDDCPYIIQGDLNTSAELAALVKAGMKRTRKYADTSSTRNASTYTNIAKDTPSTNTSWIIDGTYVSYHFWVLTYTVLRDLTRGKYRKPRPSDHDPIVSEIKI